MSNTKLINELDRVSKVLSGISGRVGSASFGNFDVLKEAHEMTVTLGFEVDNLINELMEEDA